MSWTLNGADVVEGKLQHTALGNWSASLQVVGTSAPTGRCTLALPGLTLHGYVMDGGAVAQRVNLTLAGGAGGLARGLEVPGQHFQQATGRQVAQSLLGALGEELDPASDAPGLDGQRAHRGYLQGPGPQSLDALCAELGCSWWMTPEGRVRLGAPTWAAADPADALLQDQRGDALRLDVALTTAALLPGTTYQGQRVQAVDHSINADGWRARVRYAAAEPPASSHPLDAQLRELVQALQIRTVPPLRAEVLSQGADGLELRLLMREDLKKLWGLDAGLQNVPLALLGGWALTLAQGAQVRVDFLGGDIGDPVASYLIGDILSAKLVAPQVDLGGGGSTVKLAGGSKPVIRTGDTLGTGGALISAAPASPVTGAYSTVSPGTVLA